MKKLLLFVALLLPKLTFAQLPAFNQQFTFTSAITLPSVPINLTGLGIEYWKIIWVYNGATAPANCTINLATSQNGFNFANTITGTCTSNGQSAVTTLATNYLQLTMSAYTAGDASGSVTVNILGWTTNPSGGGGGGGGLVQIQDSSGNNLTSTSGSLNVNLTNGGSGGTAATDNAAFTTGTTSFTPAGCYYSASQRTITTTHAAVFACNNHAAQFMELEDDTATEIGVAANPLRIDPTGTTTQPVSGTFWQATQPVSIAANVGVTQQTSPWVTSDTAHFPATGALSDALSNPTVSGIGAYALGWDASNSQWRRLQVDTGTGTLKVDPGTVAVTGTFWQTTQPVSGTFWQTTQPVSCTVGNCSINTAQFGGNNVVTGTGAGGSGIPRFTISNDSDVQWWDGTHVAIVDPCLSVAKTTITGSFASSSAQKILSKATGKKNYACSFYIQVQGTAETWSLIEGTQTTNQCDTSTTAISGVTTTFANGNAAAANGGLALPGYGSVWQGNSATMDWCLQTSGSNRVTWTLSYVQQ